MLGNSTLHTFSMPVSDPTATPSLGTPSYGSSTSYPTPAAATPVLYAPQTPTTSTPLHALHTPTAAAFPELRYDSATSKDEHVTRLFPTPFQSFPNFSTQYSTTPPINMAHQVSEPELVGLRATAASLNSIASMM